MQKIIHTLILTVTPSIKNLAVKSKAVFKRTVWLPVLPLILLVPLSACNTLNTSVDSSTSQSVVGTSEPQENLSSDSESAGSDANESTASISDTNEPKIVKEPVNLDADTLFNLLAAEFSGNVGDVEASLDYYQKASVEIEDSRLAARTAYIALYGKKYEETLEALDRWRELEPEANDLSAMYATTYLKLGQPKEAVPYIKDILASSGGNDAEQAMAVKQLLTSDASIGNGYLVLQRLNFGSSQIDDELIDEDLIDDSQVNEGLADKGNGNGQDSGNKNKHLLVLQSRYAAQLQRYDESLTLLDQVLEIDPSLNEVVLIKIRILTAQGKHDEAAKLISSLLEDLPDNNTLRLQYARMLVEQSKLHAAVEQYSILYKKLPNDENIVLSYALLSIEVKKLDSAVLALEHLIEIDKKVPTANYYLGRIAQNQNEEKQAVSYYLRVKSGDYTFDAQLRVGVLLASLGKPEEGLAKLEALAEAQTEWSLRVKSYLAQGAILRIQQRYKEGVEMFSRALQQKQDDTHLLYARGLMAEKDDRIDMTEADLLQVISKEPDNANALNALGFTLADRTARYQEAKNYIKRAAELVPDDPAILDSLGWVSYRLGEIDEALKWLSQAFEKLEDAEIAAHYGEVLWHANEKDKAREVWEKGKASNDKNPVLLETLGRIKP